MKKSTILWLVGIALVLIIGIVLFTKKSSQKSPTTTEENVPDLPINTIPVEERPFITLSPDSTGRSLDISLSNAPKSGNMEYEMIYNASGKQEGALGSIYLGTEKQPIIKSILLGSKSGGGKVTYHEGVTGGSITVTYGTTRLKESWNYLHFDPIDPSFSSTDGRFNISLDKAALKKDSVIITMKTFGYPKLGLPDGSAKPVVGPYGYFTQTPIKGVSTVSLKLPAGDHINPMIYQWDGTTWKKLATKLMGDTVTATATSNPSAQSGVFLVISE